MCLDAIGDLLLQDSNNVIEPYFSSTLITFLCMYVSSRKSSSKSTILHYPWSLATLSLKQHFLLINTHAFQPIDYGSSYIQVDKA